MNVDNVQRVYEELAQRHERQHDERQRDICLLLAADAALAAGRPGEAERLRQCLLQVSPHSMLRPYATFAEALQSGDIQDYIADLRRQLPPSQAERLLHGDNGEPAAKPTSTPTYRFQEPVPPRMPTAKPPAAAPEREKSGSPYEQHFVALPPARNSEAWGNRVALVIFVLVLAAAVLLGAFILARPFLP